MTPIPATRPTPLTDWETLLQQLPADLDASAFRYGALLRKRNVPSAAVLLRLICAYATGLSLRAVTTWATAVGLATLSPVALDHRLRDAAAWLRHLVAALLLERAGCRDRLPLRVRLADATTVQRPGRTTLDQRLHLGLDLWHQRLDAGRRTAVTTGEHLQHLPMTAHELIIGDRGLASRPGIWAVHQAGAASLLRLPWTFPVRTDATTPWHLATQAATLAPGASAAWTVETCPTHTLPALPGRIILYRLTDDELARARATRRRKARKTYRKDRPKATHAEGLEKCAYLILWTTLPATVASPAQVLALYRLRWQIELCIKRYKQLGDLATVRAQTDALTATTVYAHLLLTLLGEDLCQQAEVFSP